MIRRALYILMFSLVLTRVLAQNEGTLTFMNSLPQVVYNNPAIVPKYKVSVGLPGSSVMAFYSNNGFSYNDAVKHENDSVKADLSKLYGALKPKNYITQALQVDLFRLSLKINSKLYLTLNSTAKVYNRVMIPKDLMGLFVNGNESFIGKTATLSPKAESTTLIETALGGSYKVNNKLTIGARLKYLKGLTNATTQSASLNLTTDNSGYALTASAGMDVRTSGIYNFTQSGFDFSKSYKGYLSNNGLAIDIGATYRLLNRLTVGASLIDIGSIHWQNNTYGYTLDPSKANYTFPGVDLTKVINGNSNYLNSLGDTLQNKFKVKEGAIGGYNTPIPGKMYLTGMYEIKKNFTAGAVLFAEKFQGRFATGITLGVNKHFGRVFSAAGSYSIASNSFNNLGAGMSLNLSPIQIYFVGDNLLRIPLAGKEINSYVNSTKFFNIRVGINFVFGWDKEKDKQKAMDPKSDTDSGIKRKLYRNYTTKKPRKK